MLLDGLDVHEQIVRLDRFVEESCDPQCAEEFFIWTISQIHECNERGFTEMIEFMDFLTKSEKHDVAHLVIRNDHRGVHLSGGFQCRGTILESDHFKSLWG